MTVALSYGTRTLGLSLNVKGAKQSFSYVRSFGEMTRVQ